MRLGLALSYCIASGLLHGAPVLDLDSPFNKIALVENRLGQNEEFEITSAKIVGENIEFKKLDGSILLAPQSKVSAILPKLPLENIVFVQQDAQEALVLLERAAKIWPDRQETAPQNLLIWRELAKGPSPHEQKYAAERSAKIKLWLESVQPEEGKPRPADLQEYILQGEQLVKTAGPQTGAIMQHLQKVRDFMSMDLEKIRENKLPAEQNNFDSFVPVGLAGILMVLFFWVLASLGNFFFALKTGMVRTSGKGGVSRISLSFRGIVYLFYAATGAILLFFLLQSGPEPAARPASASSRILAERSLYLSMNVVGQWSTQLKSSKKVEATALVEMLQTVLPVGEFEPVPLITYQGPRVLWSEEKIFWRQRLQLLFVPIHMDFLFLPPKGNFFLEKLEVQNLKIGAVPLGGFLGNLIWQKWSGTTSIWDRALGLKNGAVWLWSERDSVQVETPEINRAQHAKIQPEVAKQKPPMFQQDINANDLIQIFLRGEEKYYQNRTINLAGNIIRVNSGRRLGNTLASETARKTGGLTASKAAASSGQEDFPDEFYLSAEGEGIDSKIQIKVMVKCPHVYFLDSRGDLYRSGANPNLSTPVVARHKRALFKGGRLEGMEKNVIEIYGAQPPEEVP